MNAASASGTGSVERVRSLDVFRGMTMLSMLAGTLGLKELSHIPAVGFVYTQLTHAPWRGFHFEDAILPAFLFIIGVSLALSNYKRRMRGESSRLRSMHMLKRAAALFALGFLLSWISAGRPYSGAGVLQVLALSYLGAAVVAGQSGTVRWVAFWGLLFVYWLFIFIIPVPGAGRNSYVLFENLVYWIDDIVTGNATRWGYLYPLITSTAVVVFGAIAGSRLAQGTSREGFMRTLAIWGAGGIVLGLALHPSTPIIKRMFTPSYTLLTCGISCLAFLILYWIVDVRGHRAWSFPFIVVGANSIFVYMLNGLLGGWLTQTAGILLVPAAGMLGAWVAPMQEVMRLAVEWLVCLWLYRRGIFFKL